MADPNATGVTNDQYSIEKLAPSHYPLLRQLYRNAFGQSVSLEEIRQRFDTEKLGSPVIGFIAIHRPTNIAAAYYGVFPLKARIGGRVIQAAQSGDTMTHDDHRRKGFFVKLAQLTYDECRKAGISILIGQPNEYSYHGLVNSLGWKQLDEVVRWDLKLKFKNLPLGKIVRRYPFLHKFYLTNARVFLKKRLVDDIHSFNNPLVTEYGKIERDEDYLAYKDTIDKFLIKIEDTILWIRLTDIFWIGDFHDYATLRPSVLKKIKQLAFTLGYNTISLNLNKSIPLPEALRSFKRNSSQASCFLYLDKSFDNQNFVLTAADSDTW